MIWPMVLAWHLHVTAESANTCSHDYIKQSLVCTRRGGVPLCAYDSQAEVRRERMTRRDVGDPIYHYPI